MAPNDKLRRGGTSSTASSSHSLLLLVAAYGLATVLIILQGAPTASAEKMDTTNTMNDPSDMIEDFAREMMEEGVIDMWVNCAHATPSPFFSLSSD